MAERADRSWKGRALSASSAAVPPLELLRHPGGCACGGACPRCLASPPGGVSGDLRISSPDDPLEVEAARLADTVLESDDGLVQREAFAGAPAPTGVADVVREAGAPLDAGTRTFMEGRFGRDFAAVRVHTDQRAANSAAAVGALAYTVGTHLVFGDRRYRPGTDGGRRLIAHELAHVAQHDRGAAPLLRRACAETPTGLGATAPGETCASGGPGATSGSLLYFCQDSAELVDDDQRRYLTKLAALAAWATAIEVHGSASIEGPGAGYNQRLACHRAGAIAARLRAEGVTAPIKLVSHGRTRVYGDARFNRNVVVVMTVPKVVKSLTIVSWISPEGLRDFDKVTIGMTPAGDLRVLTAIEMLLKCTANKRPPAELKDEDLAAFAATKEYRALQHYSLHADLSGIGTGAPLQQPGYTAPSQCGCKEVPPCSYLLGEVSPLSYYKASGASFEALMKFRVSAAEEDAAIKALPDVPVWLGGISLSQLPRVAWVWNKTIARLDPKTRKLSWLIGASAFPTHTIYVDGRQVDEISQLFHGALLGKHIRSATQPRQSAAEESAQADVPLTKQDDTVRAGDFASGEN